MNLRPHVPVASWHDLTHESMSWTSDRLPCIRHNDVISYCRKAVSLEVSSRLPGILCDLFGRKLLVPRRSGDSHEEIIHGAPSLKLIPPEHPTSFNPLQLSPLQQPSDLPFFL